MAMEKGTEQVKSFTDAWEKAATCWWDTMLHDAATLQGMGQAISALSALKERQNRAMEDLWSLVRLPTAADIERLHERLGDIERRLAALEQGTPAAQPKDSPCDTQRGPTHA